MIAPNVELTLAPRAGGLAVARRDGAGLSAEGLLLGRPVAEACRLLPLVFGLCRSVQETALALALDQTPPAPDALRREMVRDHLAKLCLHLPRVLGLPARPLPAEREGVGLRAGVFGDGGLPGPATFARWLRSEDGVAPVVAAVARSFEPGEATSDLPDVAVEAPFDSAPRENSLIQRHWAHPLLAHVETRWGHGPLAHLVARLIDLDALSRGTLPAPVRPRPGVALVPCSRGLCALRLRAAAGLVVDIARRTPTDALLAPGGLLDASLRRLAPGRAGLAPLLVEVLDPCLPVRIAGGVHA